MNGVELMVKVLVLAGQEGPILIHRPENSCSVQKQTI